MFREAHRRYKTTIEKKPYRLPIIIFLILDEIYTSQHRVFEYDMAVHLRNEQLKLIIIYQLQSLIQLCFFFLLKK